MNGVLSGVAVNDGIMMTMEGIEKLRFQASSFQGDESRALWIGAHP